MVSLRTSFCPPALLTTLLVSVVVHGLVLSGWHESVAPAAALPLVIALQPSRQAEPMAAPRAQPAAAPSSRRLPRPTVAPLHAQTPVAVRPEAGVAGSGSGSGVSRMGATDVTPGTGAVLTDREADYRPAYLNNPAPAYPLRSRETGEEGRVVLRVVVSREGRVMHVDVEQGSGFSRLDRAAREAVADWRFVPARKNGHDSESVVLVPIPFRLD